MKQILKKVISMLIVACLMITIANIPVYAGANTILPSKTSDAVLSQPYYTPAKIIKKSTKTKPLTAKKVTKKTTKKATVSSAVKNLASKNVKEINKLLKKKGISKIAKTWLKKAKTLINSIKNGKQSNKEKQTLLKKALTAIKKVAKAKASTLSLVQQSYSSSSVFSKLKSILKNNIIYKTYAKYGTNGVTIVTKLAKNIGVQTKTVYNQFLKYGVTKLQLNVVSAFSKRNPAKYAYTSTFLRDLDLKGRFDNCGSVALATCLNISRKMATLQHVAADIALGEVGSIGSTMAGVEKVAKMNSKGNMGIYELPLDKFMANLKAGEKAMLSVATDGSTRDHIITVVKEKDGSYGVFDINVNKGKKVVYTAANFKNLMNGKTVTGKTTKGKKIKNKAYYKAMVGNVVCATTNSSGVVNQGRKKNIGVMHIISEYEVNYLKKENKNLIKSLLNKKGISALAKTWLNKAYSSIDSLDYTFLQRALEKLNEVKKDNVSILSLIKASDSYYFSNFAGVLNDILKNNITYKIYNKYGEVGLNIVNGLSEKLNVSQEIIYKKFIDNNFPMEEIYEANFYFEQFKNNNDFLDLFYCQLCTNNNKLMATAIKDLTGNSLDLTDKIYKQCGREGYLLIKEFSQKTNISQEEAFNIFKEYGQRGAVLINGLSEKLGIGQKEIYEKFINSNINTSDIYVLNYYFQENKEESLSVLYTSVSKGFGYSSKGISSDKTRILTTLKELMESAGLELTV